MDSSQYFYRNVVFTRRNGKVALADIHNPDYTTELEDWLGLVISLADGKHTLQQLTEFIATQYPASVPVNLQDTIESVIQRLTEGELIKLTDQPVELPYYLSQPIEQLNPEVAKRKMHEDGYTQH